MKTQKLVRTNESINARTPRPRSPYGRFTRDIRTVHYRSLSRQARAPLVAQPEEWMKYRYDCARAARVRARAPYAPTTVHCCNNLRVGRDTA